MTATSRFTSGRSGSGRHRPIVEGEHQLVERLGRVASRVERGRGVVAAPLEEGGECVLEPGRLLQAALAEAGRGVDRPVEHRSTHGVGEQRHPRRAQLAAIAEPEVADLLFAEGLAERVHVAGRVVGADVLDDVAVGRGAGLGELARG